MNKIIAILFIFFSAAAIATNDIEEIASNVYEAFKKENLDKLDDKYIFEGLITIEIEPTLNGSENTVIAQLSNWKKVEIWLQENKTQRNLPGYADLPTRGEGTLEWCKFGLCLYNLDGKMAHNHIFIKKIWYRQTKQGAQIYAISILDGD